MKKLLALAVTIACLLPAPLNAAPGGQVSLTIQPGLGGASRPGLWTPVEVDVANSGPALTGSVEVAAAGSPTSSFTSSQGGLLPPQPVNYTAPISVPEHSTRRLTIPVLAPTNFNRLDVRVVSGAKTVAEQQAQVQPLNTTDVFCGVLSTKRGSFDSVNAVAVDDNTRQARVAYLDLPDLPANEQLMESVDCLIVSDYSTSGLGAPQKATLKAWVANGGVLIVGTGPDASRTLAGLPPDLLPARVAGSTELPSLSALADFFGSSSSVKGSWPAAKLEVGDGQAVVADESLPILVGARRGRGAVFMSALSLADEPIRGWDGAPRLWQYLLTYTQNRRGSAPSSFTTIPGWGRIPRVALSQAEDAMATGSFALIWGLGLFLLLVGPVNFFVLRRFNRLDLALLTVPTLAVATTVGAVAFAQAHQASDVIVNEASVLRSFDGDGSGVVRTFVGYFGMRRDNYTLTVPDQTLVSVPQGTPRFPTSQADQGQRGPAVDIQTGSGAQVDNLGVVPGVLSSLTIEGETSQAGRVDSTLEVQNGSLVGEVRNGLGQPIRQAALIAGVDAVTLGDLGAGSSKAVSLRLSPASPVGYRDLSTVVRRIYPSVAPNAPPSEVAAQDIIDAALVPRFSSTPDLDGSPVELVGWVDLQQRRVTVAGAQPTGASRTLFITTLPVRMPAGQSGQVPTQLVARQTLTPGLGGKLTDTALRLQGGDSIAYQFSIPTSSGQFRVTSLDLALGANTDPVGDWLVFNWQSDHWDALKLALGDNVLPTPGRYISAVGTVRVRFQYKPPPGSGGTEITFNRFELLVRGGGQ